jgi:DNA replication protein DnaC
MFDVVVPSLSVEDFAHLEESLDVKEETRLLLLQTQLPTAKLEEQLERAQYDLKAIRTNDLRGYSRERETRLLVEIENVQKFLEKARERDALQAERPEGCWCLGVGGSQPSFLYGGRDVSVRVLAKYCSCPESQARRALDQAKQAVLRQAECDERAERFVEKLPLRLQAFTLDTYPTATAPQKALLKTLRAWQESLDGNDAPAFPWLLLRGPFGTGKSALAGALAADCLRRGSDRSALFVPVPEFLDRLRHTFGDDARESERKVMQQLQDVDVLVLDDLGAERQTDWVTERLYVLVNHRYDHDNRTIITTNLTPEELGVSVGKRTMWRIVENAQFVSLDGCVNLRQVKAKKGRDGGQAA